MLNNGMYSSETDLWSTPQDFYDELNREFGFVLDACALPCNAKCKSFFTPRARRFAAGLGKLNMVQPAVWAGNWQVGAQGPPRS